MPRRIAIQMSTQGIDEIHHRSGHGGRKTCLCLQIRQEHSRCPLRLNGHNAFTQRGTAVIEDIARHQIWRVIAIPGPRQTMKFEDNLGTGQVFSANQNCKTPF